MSILDVFCDVDGFWQEMGAEWEHTLIQSGGKPQLGEREMYPSEIMALLIPFHQSYYRTFKHYYTKYVQVTLRREFPRLLSYNKNISQIEHSHHRSPINFLVNLIVGLIACCWQPTKPTMSREIPLDLVA